MKNLSQQNALSAGTSKRVRIASLLAAPFKGGSLRTWINDISDRFELLGALWLRARWTKAKLLSLHSDFERAQRSFAARGEEFNFDPPVTFNEKLWFLKLSNRDPILVECSDKHRVRGYVERCGLAHILKKEYGSYSSVSDLDFDSLPSPSYIKCSHGSGLNWIYRKETSRRDRERRKRDLKYQLRQNPYLLSREWNYKDICPTVVCEEVIVTASGEPVPELQFFCFHGEVRLIMYNVGLADETGAHKKATRWVFSPEFELLDIKTSMPTSPRVPAKPVNYEEMLRYAKILAAPFPHVRVDLFNADGAIYFNELTFYSGGGFVALEPPEWQHRLGSWLKVEGYTIAPDALEGGLAKIVKSFVRNGFR